MAKVLVIGAGNVGAHIINYGVARDINAEFFLLDINQELEKAQVLDLKDTLLFSHKSKVEGLSFNDPQIADMDVVIVTAGANQGPGETRCDLLNKNAAILQDIAQKLGPLKTEAVVLLVTNPVDILTHLAYGIFDLPRTQIIGSGTLLDSARLRWRLSELWNVNPKSTHGYVLGEHGDSEFVAWSTVSDLFPIDEAQKETLETEVRQAAYEIINGKGSTYFGISAAAIKLLEAILNNTEQVLPVSTLYPHTQHVALQHTPIGVPAVLGRSGILEVPELPITADEMTQLEASAQKLQDLYNSCPLKP